MADDDDAYLQYWNTPAAPEPSAPAGAPGSLSANETRPKLVWLFRGINVGLCAAMFSTGIISLAKAHISAFSENITALYLLLFALTLFTFEVSQVVACDVVVGQLKRNFGFLFSPMGKSLFIIFCAFLNFGVTARSLGLITGICTAIDGVVLILLYLKYPDMYPRA
jgi:hypothetical protein